MNFENFEEIYDTKKHHLTKVKTLPKKIKKNASMTNNFFLKALD